MTSKLKNNKKIDQDYPGFLLKLKTKFGLFNIYHVLLLPADGVLIHDFNEQFEIHLLQNRSLQLPNFLLYSVILQLKNKGRVAKSITG